VAEPTVHTEVPSSAHAEPTIGGFMDAAVIVALSTAFVIALLLWKKVPAAIGKALDNKIRAIRDQLAAAAALRKEAEALKAEYQAKADAANEEAAAMIERARHEADAIIAKARQDAELLVERRGRMAEEKIAAEERAAVDQLRSTAADAARRAAERLIVERVNASTDKALVDQAIGSIGR
jgi:F-type H+-transporting ATPase subunit b